MTAMTIPEQVPTMSASTQALRRRQFGETVANAVTHGVGALLSIAALAVMTAFAAPTGSAVVMTSVVVFGASMIVLYTASTVYHSVSKPGAKRILQIFDRSAIYLLIAGSYTPFCFVTLGGTTGWTLGIAVWVCAAVGILLQPLLIRRGDALNSILYAALGWCVMLVLPGLLEALPTAGLWLLAGGGLAYTSGIVFFLWERLPYSHALWHLFVLAGTALQFFCVLFYVIP